LELIKPTVDVVPTPKITIRVLCDGCDLEETSPLHDMNVRVTIWNRRLRFEGRSWQNIDRSRTPWPLLERSIADRKEVERFAGHARRRAHPNARVGERHRILVAVENSKVDWPQAIGGGIHGLTVAKGDHIHRLAWHQCLQIGIARAMQEHRFVVGKVAEELPAGNGQGMR